MDIMEQMYEDTVQLPESSNLSDLTKLIMELKSVESDVAKLQLELLKKEQELKQLSEVKIPEMFLSLGVSRLDLEDGSSVVIKKFYAASISEENRDLAFAWLRNNEHGDLIKHEVKTNFGKGEDEKCEEVKQLLIDNGVNFTDKESVHPQTLKAFVKEQIESEHSTEFPLKLFNVYIGEQTKIQAPKIQTKKRR